MEISIIQILCEINFGDSRSAKSDILTHFDFYEVLHFLKTEIYILNNIQSCQKMVKPALLELLNSVKLMSRKK